MARSPVDGGLPLPPFRLRGGSTVPPWTTFPSHYGTVASTLTALGYRRGFRRATIALTAPPLSTRSATTVIDGRRYTYFWCFVSFIFSVLYLVILMG